MCVWRDERENRERKDEERGVEAWGDSSSSDPYRGDVSLGDPRYVGQRENRPGPKVALCLRTSVYSSTRIREKKDGCLQGSKEWMNRPLLWDSGSRYRSPWEPGAEGSGYKVLPRTLFRNLSHTEQPSRTAPR